MKKILKKILVEKLGVDKAIAYSSSARVVQAFTGVGSVFFISTFLTGVEQGFYFTFGSILALQIFFELGLTGIMTQYVAHEVSHLSLDENGEFQGESRFKSRLASLIQFCAKWYFVLAIIVSLFLLIVGFVYFSKFGDSQSENVSWRIPWIIICIATAIKFFQSPFNSILQGLGFVKDTSQITFWQQIILPTFTWIGLAMGLKLYVTGIGYFLSVLVWFFFVFKKKLFRILVNLFKTQVSEKVSYMKEIFPYQWRIALSWISGYFIFQLFNPVLFATEGAVVAGQMGMTMTALSAVQSFSMSWLGTKVPLYSQLIARKEYQTLDGIFFKTLKQMAGISGFLLIAFFLFMVLLRETGFSINGSILADRFLGYMPMFLMMIPVFVQQFVNSFATYLRCHKKEPFLVISIVTGIACMLSTLVFGKLYGLNGITIGYCVIQILSLPWAYLIFKNKRHEWHEGE